METRHQELSRIESVVVRSRQEGRHVLSLQRDMSDDRKTERLTLLVPDMPRESRVHRSALAETRAGKAYLDELFRSSLFIIHMAVWVPFENLSEDQHNARTNDVCSTPASCMPHVFRPMTSRWESQEQHSGRS